METPPLLMLFWGYRGMEIDLFYHSRAGSSVTA
jgi:hypothetical protein